MDRGGKDLQHDGQRWKTLQHDGQIMEKSYSMMDRSWKDVTAWLTDHGKALQYDGQIMERSYSMTDRSWKGTTTWLTDHGKELQHDGQRWKGVTRKGVTARCRYHGKELQHDGQIMERGYSMMERCAKQANTHKEGTARAVPQAQIQIIHHSTKKG